MVSYPPFEHGMDGSERYEIKYGDNQLQCVIESIKNLFDFIIF